MALSRRSRERSQTEGGGLAALVAPVLLVLIAWPLSFIVLQAIFPEIGAGSLARPFALVSETLSDPRLVEWTFNTLKLGLGVMVGSFVVGVPLGMLRGLFKVPGGGLWDVLFTVPFTIPPYIAALGWIFALQPHGYLDQIAGFNVGKFLFSYWGVVFVMTLNVFPVVYFAVSRSVAAISGRYLEAARVCGAAPSVSFRRILLPLTAPAIAASLLLVFAMSIEEFGTPAVLAARSGFLVLVTGVEQRLSDYPIDLPGAAMLSIVLVMLALAAFVGQHWIVNRRDTGAMSGKPSRQELMELGRYKPLVLAGFAAVATVGTMAPIASVLITASTRTISGGLAADNLSLDNFRGLADQTSGAMEALLTSFSLGIGTALITGLVGVLTALVTVRQKTRMARVLDFLSLVPNTIPGVVIAVGLILAWTQPWLPLTVYNTPWVLVFAYCCLLLPYPVRYATTAVRQMGSGLEDAARVFGARPVTLILRIVLPLILPSMVAAMLLVFAVASRELVATILLAPLGTETIATFIWNQFEQGSVGLGMAMSSVAILVTLSVPALAALVSRRFAATASDKARAGTQSA
ncbi:putative 2-aminoethylphosphonate transport system permease protein PhnV [Hartmannibacter diazotrophicus]|uniref:Putative 2-aminoethylphosphonate transport system permease protein PhnV n=1 Tax=Hartmannibacter diazotrophicus TaxID=1482074 RepID=A0A2C9D1U4_9HYPH|nr:iron ABC transporter permease [Hartmannibacter diazotrophicus]SON54216.1 putative 2-aminoethylphosphonate transport system permease protein PhnV [Hartmannibacter diazotrophicus]